MSRGWIEIGSGEDGHYDWDPEFSDLKKIDLILTEFESDDKLSLVKEQTPYWKHSDSEPDLWTLIEPFVTSEREFHDPDQPNASVWKQILLEKKKKKKFLEMIDKVLIDLRTLKNEYLVRQCEQKGIKSYEVESHKQGKEKAEKGLDLVFQIVSHLKSGTKDLECFGNFLVSRTNNQIYYLSRHENYRKEVPEEELVAKELEKDFHVVHTYESSQPDDPWIPYFAGPRRLKVMGWRQVHSRLYHKNEDTLQTLLRVRNQFCNEESPMDSSGIGS